MHDLNLEFAPVGFKAHIAGRTQFFIYSSSGHVFKDQSAFIGFAGEVSAA